MNRSTPAIYYNCACHCDTIFIVLVMKCQMFHPSTIISHSLSLICIIFGWILKCKISIFYISISRTDAVQIHRFFHSSISFDDCLHYRTMKGLISLVYMDSCGIHQWVSWAAPKAKNNTSVVWTHSGERKLLTVHSLWTLTDAIYLKTELQ